MTEAIVSMVFLYIPPWICLAASEVVFSCNPIPERASGILECYIAYSLLFVYSVGGRRGSLSDLVKSGSVERKRGYQP